MTTLFLLCGLPGSGKTTLAKQLEIEHHALRLTPDEWMGAFFNDGYNETNRSAVEVTQWKIAERVLTLGIDVILDWGFWSRTERDDFRARATAVGAHTRVLFLDVPYAELLRRLTERNEVSQPDVFRVEKEHLDLWSSWFEAPTADELVEISR